MVSAKSKPGEPLLIADDVTLRAFADRIKDKKNVAFDTEAASYHRYVDRIYLIQMSSGDETAIIDPLAVTNLKPIGRILANPNVEVIFHDADYDLRVLDRDYGFHARCVFDTRVAAQLAGEPGVGLGSLLEKYFQIAVNKKYQRADWSKRPLSAEMIAYAAGDTAYLVRLRDILAKELKKQNRMAWAEEEFKRIESFRWTQPNGDKDAYLRLKGAKTLHGKNLAVPKTLHKWRESAAKKVDRAPFRILGNDALLALAKALPTDVEKLKDVQGFPSSAVDRYGADLLKHIQKTLELPKEKWPRVARKPHLKLDEPTQARMARIKTHRKMVSEEVGLEVGLVCPNGLVQAIAIAQPKSLSELKTIAGIKAWQIEALGGEKLLELVNGKS